MIKDPVAAQWTASTLENETDPFALDDPLGEARWQKTPRLVHQYANRVLLKTTDRCFRYCRFCFRRRWVAGLKADRETRADFINREETEAACAYIAAHAEIREILLSGGDVLTADNDALAALFQALRKARPGVVLRVCTRAPIVKPERVDNDLVALCAEERPLRLIVHVNHVNELTDQRGQPLAAALVLRKCVEAGIPVHTQTVLLQGVNDNAQTLAALFQYCVELGVTPYYLFQLDLAPGTKHWRVPLRRGLAIYRELKGLVSGLALPKYAVDLPGGGGKILLDESVIAGERDTPKGRALLLRANDGALWEYPA
jgi:lysine 2,3-aminomutase